MEVELESCFGLLIPYSKTSTFSHNLFFSSNFHKKKEVTRAHKGWALDSVVLQNQITRYNKEDIHDPPAEGKSF